MSFDSNSDATVEDELPDLERLAEATQRALEVFRPWKNGDTSRPNALTPVANQVASCKYALAKSIVVAQQGYTLAEEAIGFALHIDADGISENDRQGYLVNMSEIATTASTNVKQAQEYFRNGRVKLLQLIKDAEGKVTESDDNSARNHLHRLEEDTSVLINMENALSSVIAWWTGVAMTHAAQETSSKMNLEGFNTIRQKSIVKRWTNLKTKYVAYCTKIQEIEDANPDLASDLNILREAPEGSVDSKAGSVAHTSDSAIKATVLQIRPGKSIRISVVVPPFTKKGDSQWTPLSATLQRSSSMSQTNHLSPIASDFSSPIPTVTVIPMVNGVENRSSPSNSPLQYHSLPLTFPLPSSPISRPQSLHIASSHSSRRSPVSLHIARTSSSQSSPDSGPPQPSPGDSSNLDAFKTVELGQILEPPGSHENTNAQEPSIETPQIGDLAKFKSSSSKPEEIPSGLDSSAITLGIYEVVRPVSPSPLPMQSNTASATGTPGGQATALNPNEPAFTSTPSGKTTHKGAESKQSEAEEGCCSKCCIIS